MEGREQRKERVEKAGKHGREGIGGRAWTSGGRMEEELKAIYHSPLKFLAMCVDERGDSGAIKACHTTEVKQKPTNLAGTIL